MDFIEGVKIVEKKITSLEVGSTYFVYDIIDYTENNIPWCAYEIYLTRVNIIPEAIKIIVTWDAYIQVSEIRHILQYKNDWYLKACVMEHNGKYLHFDISTER